jgi:hypothetical protein
MDWIGGVGLATGVIGVAPTLAILGDWAREQLPLHRALGFRSKSGIEIVVTTAHTGISSVGPADESQRAIRSLVPSGDLAGVADISAKLARVYPKRKIVVVPSTRAGDNNSAEKLIVGGPIHNSYASHVICGRSEDATSDTEVVLDANERYIRFGSREFGPRLDLRFEDNVPSLDYAVVILTEITRYGEDQRVVLVGGLTTYGTLCAANFLAHDLTSLLKRIKERKRPQIAILLECQLTNGRPFRVKAIDHIPVS